MPDHVPSVPPAHLAHGPRQIEGGAFAFSVWAPRVARLELQLMAPVARRLAMSRGTRGLWTARVAGLAHGQQYRFLLDDARARPDPAAHHQPEGVHGPSALVDHERYAWQVAAFRPPTPEALVFYELHVGTFTPEGTFAVAIPRLAELKALGITALEVMPVAAFSGARNWGYDGVQPFAVQASYGGPEGFKAFIDAAHGLGLAVYLDVVFNHLGPEGSYQREFGPYFTADCRTPWGQAVNLDGPGSDFVRGYFVACALHWLERYRLDGLRLDATHALLDRRPVHFLRELRQAVETQAARLGRPARLVAETNLNDPRLVEPPGIGGHGLAALWCDDLHHALHALLTGERDGYYQDYGRLEHLAAAVGQGFTYQGEHSAYRDRAHGSPCGHLPSTAFVVCLQNHDQVGNRALGERLSALVPREACLCAAALVLLSPFTPFLFMGEEYAESAPFLYFTSHDDAELAAAVTRGRRKEFADFAWAGEPPDPQAPETFARSRLDWSLRQAPGHRRTLAWYTALLAVRRGHLGLITDREHLVVVPQHAPGGSGGLSMRYGRSGRGLLLLANLTNTPLTLDARRLLPAGQAHCLLDSREARFGGPGASSVGAVGVAEVLPAALELPPFAATLYAWEETPP